MHIMFDLETWGTQPGSAIRSIGAVVFNPNTGRMGASYYANISDESCRAAGLKVDPGTQKWWASQSKEAQDSLLDNQKPLAPVIVEFHRWFRAQNGRYAWCQGAGFDAPLWEAAAAAVRCPIPWKFWDVRDTRTAYDLANFDPKSLKREGTYHNALDDAKHQVACVVAAISNIHKAQYP
jgi:hypothetical protein